MKQFFHKALGDAVSQFLFSALLYGVDVFRNLKVPTFDHSTSLPPRSREADASNNIDTQILIDICKH